MLASEVRVTEHGGSDDLLSAGLGLAGLQGAEIAFALPADPTPAELRRRAIHANWQDIADLGPLGGYGSVYGAVPAVPGREYQALARLPGADVTHRVLAQIPDDFDRKARCLVVAASSGSRGVYGAIALAGAFGLPRGCAVVYTDKAAGTGYFDTASRTGVQLDGTRAEAGEAQLEFEPEESPTDAGIAVKHLHSGGNPEADWGRYVLQAARFGLAMLDRAFPDQAPFTADNTRIIATGLSNGGGAVLQAAGIDDGLLDGVVALEPNVHVPGAGRALYDYATEAALWMPCALADASFAAAPLARQQGEVPPAFVERCASLERLGLLDGTSLAGQAAEALAKLHASGWNDKTLATAAATTVFDVWRAVGAGYASAYVGTPVGAMPCGFSYQAADAENAALRATWWADASGIPPGAGIDLVGGTDDSSDPTLPGIRCLRALWADESAAARKLHASIDQLAVDLPRKDLPIWVLHGASDGLLPVTFTSDPYVAWLRDHGRLPRYWPVPHAQHFDAFLAVPGFGAAHVPLLPYGYFALDAMYRHLIGGQPLPNLPAPDAQPRGDGPLTEAMLDLP